MDTAVYFVVLCCTVVAFLCNTGFANELRKQKAVLVKELVENYTASSKLFLRPMAGPDGVDAIFIKWIPVSVVSFNAIYQSITLRGLLTLAWKDDLLTWNPQDYGGIKHVLIPMDQIWGPNIVLNESVQYEYASVYRESEQAIVYSCGCVFWDSPVISSTFCKVGVSAFPFDRQNCDLTFFSTDYGEVHYHPLVEDYQELEREFQSLFTENGIWRMEGQPQQKCKNVRYSSLFNLTTPGVRYTLKLKREGVWFHLLTLFLPCVLLSFLSVCVFFLPVDSGEKISFMITILLALFVYQGVVSEEGPPTGTPIFAYYIVLTIFETLIAIVSTIHVIRFHFDVSWFVKFDEWVMTSVRKYTTKRRKDSDTAELREVRNGINDEQESDLGSRDHPRDHSATRGGQRGSLTMRGGTPRARLKSEKVQELLHRNRVNELDKGLAIMFFALKVLFFTGFFIFELVHALRDNPSLEEELCPSPNEALEMKLRDDCIECLNKFTWDN
ncbi:Acetylcholine receptor subunit epsilon [Holothuria leucospilota]|uniref:Acetylcholine receptor subunit epsilon n=1 Tax=Holothuria leucospilota TaxID=206669 RepID=A0A9Q1CB78_HOLLE|nr:Acetylcholine receptor subunit epsilon [Holothuria leucospilota]